MPGPKPPPIYLSEAEKQGLDKLVKRHKAEQQLVLRARIVLAAAEGQNNSQIAQALKVGRDMVRTWRERWLILQPIALADLSPAERLADLPRPGTPARITADQRCQIQQVACEKPEQSGRPITHWTARELADEVIKRGIVEQLSPRHAGRLLKGSGSEAASNPLLAHPRSR